MNKPRILIIDDDAGLQKILELQLNLSGFATLHAISPEEGLAHLNDDKVDLVILDVSMPGMDGFQLLKRIRNSMRGKDVPVIFLSSFDRQYLKIKGLEHGADDYITKPFDSAELSARIKAVLRRYGRDTARREGGPQHQGEVKAVGLAELLQLAAQTKKPCIIQFPEMNGAVVINNGELLTAAQGPHKGTEALDRLFLLERGRFETEYGSLPGSSPQHGAPVESLLLGTITRTDEYRARLADMGGEDTRVQPGQGKTASFLDAFRDTSVIFPVSLLDLVVALPRPLEENLDSVRKWLDSGMLVTG